MISLIKEAKRLTKAFATKNKCFATFEIIHEFDSSGSDAEFIEYLFYARIDNSFEKYESENLEDLIQKLKTLVNQEQNQ